MVATLTRKVFDSSGNLMMIIVPGGDKNLGDPAFAPAGSVTVDVPAEQYTAAGCDRDLLAVAQPFAAAKSKIVGDALNVKVQAIDDAAAELRAALTRPVFVI
jgi:hypothetical protein